MRPRTCAQTSRRASRRRSAARPLQRAGRELLRGDGRGVRRDPGEDRSRRRVEPRHPARIRDGCAAAAASRRRRGHALRRRAPARGALPAAPAGTRPASARRAHEPSRRRVGRLARAASGRVQGDDRRVTHDRYFLDNVAGWILELDRAGGFPTRATTRAGWSRSRPGWPRKSALRRRAGGRSPRSSNGCGRTPRANARSPRLASRATTSSWPRSATSKLDDVQIHIPRVRGWARRC